MLFHHCIMDGGAITSFLETWAAISKNRVVVVRPDLVRGSSVFPPRESIPSEVQVGVAVWPACSGYSRTRTVPVGPRGCPNPFGFGLRDGFRAIRVPRARARKYPLPIRSPIIPLFPQAQPTLTAHPHQ
ncbi:hypothetical protein LINPERPRIM_LOCUS20660 [Linum perenne]